MHTTLISAEELARHLDDPRFLIVDCRYDLANREAGAVAWTAAHIPGARYADLERDLSGAVTAASGRHPLPDPAAFAALLSRWGVDASTQVVAYDAAGGAFAARLWWLLRWIGHDAVAVLDGGLPAWQAAGGALDQSVQARAPSAFRARARPQLSVSADEVAAALAQRSATLVDARTAERFAGRVEPIDPVAGHVPGAVNYPFQLNLEGSGRFLDPRSLSARWRSSIPFARGSDLICMCGSGVTACHNLLALEHAGLPGARLYAGSWSEWIRSPERPVARDTG